MISNYILIVDDDPNIREGITREVEKEFENKAVVLNLEVLQSSGSTAKCLCLLSHLNVLSLKTKQTRVLH